jgi:hypothetical protein
VPSLFQKGKKKSPEHNKHITINRKRGGGVRERYRGSKDEIMRAARQVGEAVAG